MLPPGWRPRCWQTGSGSHGHRRRLTAWVGSLMWFSASEEAYPSTPVMGRGSPRSRLASSKTGISDRVRRSAMRSWQSGVTPSLKRLSPLVRSFTCRMSRMFASSRMMGRSSFPGFHRMVSSRSGWFAAKAVRQQAPVTAIASRPRWTRPRIQTCVRIGPTTTASMRSTGWPTVGDIPLRGLWSRLIPVRRPRSAKRPG